MRIRWSALLVAVLALGLMPRVGKSQGTEPAPQRKAGSLGQNYPNPFNPEARIPFTVGDYPACAEGLQKRYRVTLRVYNILAQVVAVPQLEGSSGGVAGGQRLDNVLLPCGKYTGYWNGRYLGTTREVASGVYTWVLELDGQRVGLIRSTVAK